MNTKIWRSVALSLVIGLLVSIGCSTQRTPGAIPNRRIQSLDGTWQIAEGTMDAAPTNFDHTVPVPGLASLATPPFADPPGPKIADRNQLSQKDPKRDAFWYRRIVHVDGSIPQVATLKVRKAMFGTRVILNGQLLGDHSPCFTPGYFDAKSALKTGDNELLIRVGADRNSVGPTIPSGFDYEKQRYIPGIFDSVELILSGTPHFVELQTIPDVSNSVLRVHGIVRNDGDPVLHPLTFTVTTVDKGQPVGSLQTQPIRFNTGENTTFDVQIPIQNCRLWSPEDPFLYRLTANSGADQFQTRFGMREFRFQPGRDGQPGRAWLNGKPYFMRGSNFTLYRFFEDDACGKLPWDAQWVHLLHQRVKEMHWNCLRYCIGFPPEKWYDTADELGILIQDEYPLWGGRAIDPEELTREYREWMRERWNHPCVAIWDAQNETTRPESGVALSAVRGLDLSNRPWDNGWDHPQSTTDSFESHPYHFYDPNQRLSVLNDRVGDPTWGNPAGNPNHNAIVINEYGWLWLNRDGTPTTLTRDLYRNLLGTNSTVEQRRHTYATYLAATTEFWRVRRKAAAVMHFTTLGYSRPDGQTSDHWIDVKNLTWEPEFLKYVRDAFSPVGVMVDFAGSTVIVAQSNAIPVAVVNDLATPWTGNVTLRLRGQGASVLKELQLKCSVAGFGCTNLNFALTWPNTSGPVALEAEIPGVDGAPVRSVREFEIATVASLGLAYQKPATASSSYKNEYTPQFAVDGNPSTYWSSDFADPAWLAVDLGDVKKISKVRIIWEAAYSSAYSVQASQDGQTWKDVFQTTDGKGGITEIPLVGVQARHLRIYCTKRSTQYGHAIREFQVW